MKKQFLSVTFILFALTTILFYGCKKKETEPTATCSDGIQNQNETGIDCGGSCSPCPIVYPKGGYYGANLLQTDTMSIVSSGSFGNIQEYDYSFRAELPLNTSVKIILTNQTPTTGNWVLDIITTQGWGIDNKDQTKYILYGDGQIVCDLKMYFMDRGTAKIEIFENGASTAKRTKTITWE